MWENKIEIYCKNLNRVAPQPALQPTRLLLIKSKVPMSLCLGSTYYLSSTNKITHWLSETKKNHDGGAMVFCFQ